MYRISLICIVLLFTATAFAQPTTAPDFQSRAEQALKDFRNFVLGWPPIPLDRWSQPTRTLIASNKEASMLRSTSLVSALFFEVRELMCDPNFDKIPEAKFAVWTASTLALDALRFVPTLYEEELNTWGRRSGLSREMVCVAHNDLCSLRGQMALHVYYLTALFQPDRFKTLRQTKLEDAFGEVRTIDKMIPGNETTYPYMLLAGSGSFDSHARDVKSEDLAHLLTIARDLRQNVLVRRIVMFKLAQLMDLFVTDRSKHALELLEPSRKLMSNPEEDWAVQALAQYVYRRGFPYDFEIFAQAAEIKPDISWTPKERAVLDITFSLLREVEPKSKLVNCLAAIHGEVAP